MTDKERAIFEAAEIRKYYVNPKPTDMSTFDEQENAVLKRLEDSPLRKFQDASKVKVKP